ncbi:conglutin alpha 2-like [Oncorhynchus kisutch]|uniref:conglutin alpha 2-like n=1 Tax=Oncorhynchus kisutch TaxID=8019 RepID=UPI0012DC3741|nr:conglutin alpha 2-like [Oncorhynchus kisutch]XP_031680505.1 conglutin alpha 2-like [Oncorhynchus kisutch]
MCATGVAHQHTDAGEEEEGEEAQTKNRAQAQRGWPHGRRRSKERRQQEERGTEKAREQQNREERGKRGGRKQGSGGARVSSKGGRGGGEGVVAGPVEEEGVGGQQNVESPRGSDGGMVEELAGGGGGVFLLPPSPKKRGKRKGLSTDSEREGGMEGVAKRVMGVGETSVSYLASPAPQLLEELDTPSSAQGWSTEGGSQFLFGDTGSTTLYPNRYGAGEVEEFGGQHRMQGTQEPNTCILG